MGEENLLAFQSPISTEEFLQTLGKVDRALGTVWRSAIKAAPLLNYLYRRGTNSPKKIEESQAKKDRSQVVRISDAVKVVRDTLYSNATIAAAMAEEANSAVSIGTPEEEVGFNAVAEGICDDIRNYALTQTHQRHSVKKTYEKRDRKVTGTYFPPTPPGQDPPPHLV